MEKVLLQAQEDGKRFSVIVLDSKPLLEGTDHDHLLDLCPSLTFSQPRQSTLEGSDRRVKSNTMYLCVITGTTIPLDGSDNGSFGCPFPLLKWGCILSGRYRHGCYDGESSQSTRRRLL